MRQPGFYWVRVKHAGANSEWTIGEYRPNLKITDEAVRESYAWGLIDCDEDISTDVLEIGKQIFRAVLK